jgi:hypothetical protein
LLDARSRLGGANQIINNQESPSGHGLRRAQECADGHAGFHPTQPHRIGGLIVIGCEHGSTTTRVHAQVRSHAESDCRSMIPRTPKISGSFRRIGRGGGGPMSKFNILLAMALGYVLWRLDRIGRQIEAVNADIRAEVAELLGIEERANETLRE